MHGPIAFRLEQADKRPTLAGPTLPRKSKLSAKFATQFSGGTATLTATGRRHSAHTASPLYTAHPSRARNVKLKFIPYYAWANRGPGEMAVWVNEVPR